MLERIFNLYNYTCRECGCEVETTTFHSSSDTRCEECGDKARLEKSKLDKKYNDMLNKLRTKEK